MGESLITKPTATISKISFSGGQTISLDPSSKLLVVGPNNSGKSKALREIEEFVGVSPAKDGAVVISDAEVEKNCDSAALLAYLDENATYQAGNQQYFLGSWAVHKNHLKHWDQPCLRTLHAGFLKRIGAEERLALSKPQQAVSIDEQKSKPQHVLYYDDPLMSEMSELFRGAFGTDIMFNFKAGTTIPIHVGEIPTGKTMKDRAGDDYVRAVVANPLLHLQGDGMKSYAGLLFEAIVGGHPMTLIDEPEAFLHPPQMRRLGKTLSERVDGQLIVATHSSDIMRGFLEGTKGSARILRIRRVGSVNHVYEAAPNTIKELWEKPELRYSNALEAVFHEQAILCEDDSDCKLFNSVADYLEAKSKKQWADTAYVPTGGKHAVAKIAKVLRQIGVPVKAIYDIDFLDDELVVKNAVEAFGGSWAAVQPKWKQVDAEVRNGVKPKTAAEIKLEISNLIKKADPDALPVSEIKEAMKQTKAWNLVKRVGKGGIPAGQATERYEELVVMLEAIGIYLIPVGEIENYCRRVGGHGPKFVTSLLSSIDLSDRQLSPLRSFTKQVHDGAHCRLS